MQDGIIVGVTDPKDVLLILGDGARSGIEDHPGRWSDFVAPDKPSKYEVPWRSRFYVLPADSADGNSYGKGDAIPEVEELRQRDITGEEAEAPAGLSPQERELCGHCLGSGYRMPGHFGQHSSKCPGCQTCKACEGSRYQPVESIEGFVVPEEVE